MGENSKIEWCHHTFNPWVGCTKVSAGCTNCYAENMMDKRYGRVKWGKGNPRQRTSAHYWTEPIRWNSAAERDGVRRRVFCASLADVFDEEVPGQWRGDLWDLIVKTPHLDWLLLTKRPEFMLRVYQDMKWEPLPNLWLGTSVENQQAADERIPYLLRVPAAVRFLSCEPLLGPVDLADVCGARDEVPDYTNALTGICYPSSGHDPIQGARIDWVIAGGESGPGARPTHPDWFRSLRDQCESAGVAFHFKQRGEWSGTGEITHRTPSVVMCRDGRAWPLEDETKHVKDGDCAAVLHRIGKKAAGRLLDGREHNEFPTAAPERDQLALIAG